jgi:tetratricopeptide (TPR) repeat protein
LARVRFAQRRYAAAKASLYQAATLLAEAGGPGDQLGRVTNNLGVCYRFLGDLAHARQFFERSVAAGGGVDPIPMRNLAAVLIELKAPLKAIEIAQRCVELFPKDDASRRVLAHAFDEAKRPQESVRVLEEWVATGDASAESYAVLGSELLDINQSTRAIETLNKGLVLYPEDLSVKNNLAYTYLVLGRVADARTILDSASNGQPSDRIGAILRATRGLLQLWEGHISEGERLYEEAEQLAADLDESELVAAIRQKGILERAKAHWRLGDSPVALALTRQGLAIQGRPKFRVELTDLQKELMKGSQNPLVTRD